MSKFCNNDITLKKVNTRKAPDIELDLFKEYLTDYYNMVVGIGDAEEYPFDQAENEEFIKAIYPGRYSTDFPAFASSFQFISNSEEDPEINEADPENTLMGIHVLSNKLPIYGFTLGGEGELPYFAILYWNGEHFRMYIPVYGNTYNADLNTSFMNEGCSCVSEEEIVDCVQSYELALGKSLDDIECPGAPADQKEILQAAVAYCITKHYADTETEAMEVMETVSWDAIQEDIISNIEITEETEDDRTASERGYEDREKKRLEEEEEVRKKIEASYEEDDDDDHDDDDDDEEIPTKPSLTKPPLAKEPEGEDDWFYDDDDEMNDTGSPAASEIVDVGEAKSDVHTFCNSDKSFIRIGKNRASKITLEEFKVKIEKLYKSVVAGTIYEDEDDYIMDADMLVEAFLERSAVKTNLRVVTSVIKESESSLVGNGEGASLIGYHVLPNGVSILGFEVYDGGGFVYGCAYYDGESIKSYIPNYGNTINTDSKTGFDVCGKYMNSFLIKKYESILGSEIDKDEKGFYDSDQLTRAYFISNGYDVLNVDVNYVKRTVCWKAILQDLLFSMTV